MRHFIQQKNKTIHERGDPIYERYEDELLVSVLWVYARLSANPIMSVLHDILGVDFSNRFAIYA
jgi:hypothetical protein